MNFIASSSYDETFAIRLDKLYMCCYLSLNDNQATCGFVCGKPSALSGKYNVNVPSCEEHMHLFEQAEEFQVIVDAITDTAFKAPYFVDRWCLSKVEKGYYLNRVCVIPLYIPYVYKQECAICYEQKENIRLDCDHMLCCECFSMLETRECPWCRKAAYIKNE